MESTFPLFRLPKNAIVQVLQNMDPDQLLIISLVSTKSKNLVISLGLRARCVFMDISSKISLDVAIGGPLFALDFYDDLNSQNELLSVDITLPMDAFLPVENKRIQSYTPFNFSDWLNHIQSVFCCNQPPNLYFYRNCERFEVQSLKNTIGNVDYISVGGEVADVYSKEVLKHFNARIELSLVNNPFDEACEVQKYFIQNHKIFTFYGVFSLDDMLLNNCEEVYFYHPTTQNQINRFIKHWTRGSNPRLQYMFLSIDDTNSVSREVLLKGIRCVDAAEEEKKEICRSLGIGIVSDNLFQVRRKDGTTAVIVMHEGQPVLNVLLVVLN